MSVDANPSGDANNSSESSSGRPILPDGKAAPGPQQMQQIMAEKRMAQQQAQVDEVVGIMRTNVEKVLERDHKLAALDQRADALQDGASQFEKQAGKLKNKFWLQNMKWIIALVLLLMVVGIFVYLNQNEEKVNQEAAASLKTEDSRGSLETVLGDNYREKETNTSHNHDAKQELKTTTIKTIH